MWLVAPCWLFMTGKTGDWLHPDFDEDDKDNDFDYQ
jgi:hypothetical protein